MNINPANGLPMSGDCVDIMGNAYGTDASQSSHGFGASSSWLPNNALQAFDNDLFCDDDEDEFPINW